ncbi:MAG: hypothetical protein Q9214_005065 [Letrouitia sp. 1 TL-2023]
MVYHGPSGGCRACRNRRIKVGFLTHTFIVQRIDAVQCDQTKPECHNCVQRRHTCPGYGDVFDGAHRSQNQIVRRRVERQSATQRSEHSGSGKTTSSSENFLELVPTTSSRSIAMNSSKTAPQWTMYSTARSQSWSDRNVADSRPDRSPAVEVKMDFNTSTNSIPRALEQDIQDASICFFFRHYGGTAFDPEAHNGFNQLWEPMYLQASSQSSLRLATAAVTVNIAMMWRFQGCNSRPARSLFTKSVAAARETLHDPLQSSTDEILMTILIFDLYEALVLHYDSGPVDYGKHKHGALAMIEHRGFANFATSQGRALIGAVRHSLLPYMLSSRKPFPERSDYLFDHPSVNDTKALSLDLISVQLSRVQSRLWTLRLESRLESSLKERRACYEEIIAEAFQVEKLLLTWKVSITDPDWLPEYVPRDSVRESIQNAGFYGLRCSVWVDLAFGGTWILFSTRYLLTLQVIRQSFADEASLLNNPEQRALLSKANERVQDLVDFICNTIPFYLGDNVTPKNPAHSMSINFPFKLKIDWKTGTLTSLPSLRSNHHNRAAASGGWILFPQLVNVWRLAEPEDDAVPIILREGQLDWIKEQVKRLQKIFLFCDPVWFKRLKPSPAKSI